MKEIEDEKLTKEEVSLIAIMESLNMMGVVVAQHNSVLLALLDWADEKGFKVPNWTTKEDVEKNSKLVEECVKKIETLYGQRETDKS